MFGLTFAALLVAGGGSSALATGGLSGGGTLNLNEGDDSQLLSPSISVTGGSSFASGYVDVSAVTATDTDVLGIQTVDIPDIASGVVSVSNGIVYLGDGSRAARIGELDTNKSGGAGKAVRVNFDAPFLANANFNGGTTDNWNPIEKRIKLNTDSIAGVQTSDPREGTAGFTAAATPDRDDDGSLIGDSIAPGADWDAEPQYNPNNKVYLTNPGDWRLTLRLNMYADVTSTETVFNGIGVYSDAFTAHAGDRLTYRQRHCDGAEGCEGGGSVGNPRYRMWGALLRTDGTGSDASRWTEILSYEGGGTDWNNEAFDIPATGTYRLVFVGGAAWPAASAGAARLASQEFRFDDFALKPALTSSVVQKVLRLVTYQNTSDRPPASRTVTVDAGTASGSVGTEDVTVNITDDPSTPAKPPAPAPSPDNTGQSSGAGTSSASGSLPPAPSTSPEPTPPVEPTPAQNTPAASVADALAAFFKDPLANLGALAGALFAPPNINLDVAGAVANPALGASGDDAAAPAAFDAMSSPESIKAMSEKAVLAAALAGAVAGAAAAARGSSNSGGNGGGSSDNGSGSNTDGFDSLEIESDELRLTGKGWGDRLPLLALAPVAALDRVSKRSALGVARISPMVAKLITDGAYLRAIFGIFTLVLPVVAIAAASVGLAATGGALASIPWVAMVIITVVGVFDAGAGFMGALTLVVGSVIAHGWPDIPNLRMLVGLIMLSVGPGLLMTAFRRLRREPQRGFVGLWERLSDFAIGPFMAGTVVATTVSVLPAVSGLTMPIANHVLGFGLLAAFAAALRVWLEEIAVKGYPQRLAANNPASLPEPFLAQKVFRLIFSYFVWVLITGAIIGPVWQTWVGSIFFLLPAVLGLVAQHFPNAHWLWRLIPSGVPGLAFGVILSLITAMSLLAIAGANPGFAQWVIVILPLPGLTLSILGMFAKHGKTVDEVRWSKRNPWVYRIGGVVMLIITLRLMGVM